LVSVTGFLWDYCGLSQEITGGAGSYTFGHVARLEFKQDCYHCMGFDCPDIGGDCEDAQEPPG